MEQLTNVFAGTIEQCHWRGCRLAICMCSGAETFPQASSHAALAYLVALVCIDQRCSFSSTIFCSFLRHAKA